MKIGVIEAGLGGRLDATNVIPSRATVLTSVGLDHTEWLGETLAEIAAEKLAVLRDRSVLIRGELPAEVEAVAERESARHHARMLGPAPLDGLPVEQLAPFQRANLALALRAAAEIAGDLRSEAVAAALASLSIPGRAQFIAGDPPLIVDAAHNADGAGALAAALPALAGGPGRLLRRRARGQGRRRDRLRAGPALRPGRLHRRSRRRRSRRRQARRAFRPRPRSWRPCSPPRGSRRRPWRRPRPRSSGRWRSAASAP